MPDCNLEELQATLEDKIKVGDELMDAVLALLDKRVSNLNQDIVAKQRARFQMLEQKVQKMLEQKALGGGTSTGIKTSNLQKMMETGGQVNLAG